jgi:RNA polymerase sigma factor (sigma-70 family)
VGCREYLGSFRCRAGAPRAQRFGIGARGRAWVASRSASAQTPRTKAATNSNPTGLDSSTEDGSEPTVQTELFARLAAGDRHAVSALFQTLWPKVHRFCQKALGNAVDADDAAQRTLEKVFAQAAEFDATRSILAWTLTIALWECRTIRRQSLRRRTEALPRDIHNGQPSPEQAIEQVQLQLALDTAISQLSALDQATLRALLAAEEIERNPAGNAFRKRKQRAVARLKEAWRRLYDT